MALARTYSLIIVYFGDSLDSTKYTTGDIWSWVCGLSSGGLFDLQSVLLDYYPGIFSYSALVLSMQRAIFVGRFGLYSWVH